MGQVSTKTQAETEIKMLSFWESCAGDVSV